MADSGFDFWQNHSETFLKMAFGTDRRKRIQHPDGYGKKRGDCGDTAEIFLTLCGERIVSVLYDTDGCLNTAASCNAVAHLAAGRELSRAWEIAPEDVIALLETLPADHHHCAELAVGALYLSLADAAELQRHPWKKAYR